MKAAASALGEPAPLRARRLGIHTQHEAVVFMRTDCHVCRSEGLTAHSRVLLLAGGREVLATLYQVSSDLLAANEIGLSESAWSRLGADEGAAIYVRHPEPVESFSRVRARMFGNRLGDQDFAPILSDISSGRYSDIELAAFITGTSAFPLDEPETVALTRSMVEVGDRLGWPGGTVVDKHCVGGLPGNRTTPIVVAIVAANGLTMPKTSSRAITSPAGTADTMETLAPVDLTIEQIRRVVEEESGCVVWGGAVRLSPADDVLIRVERALDLDSEGQLVASVMSKKIAAGSSHLVLDLPVGPTAKIRSEAAAEMLSSRLSAVATAFGLRSRIVLTDGTQPVGRGIGPALEAHDVLRVLQRSADAPIDLRERACALAGALLELAGRARTGEGQQLAARTLDDDRAWAKFQRICEAQGGMRVPPTAMQRLPILAPSAGVVRSIDNRRIAKLAKLAGAPDAKAAGVELHVRLGDPVAVGEPLCTVHAQTPGELRYAMDYASAGAAIFEIGN
ncbi:thymidine phosphorylase family protein [Mesorhizobium captivum]|uniref:thymidine phosphorylase family protein n=1 Tax=Mesorhizobium captivum TaxID=3072319 RepID=UPI002A2491F5|nr:thymidine phosphorylase family protein [Mesorhizobium sp. VK3C]MDX8450689.1 thymidine phosphorylase family protein [Mesorhizobium sp. VK3C]